jgi:hypothetical protein
MDISNQVFDLLDDWRHLPCYQLERRADIFFAACLPRFLSEKLKLDIRPQLIPEFPARIGTLYPESGSNQSKKIDYVAIDAPGRHAIFVELKTDMASRDPDEDANLRRARDVGLSALLEGVPKIVCASDHKRKYWCLLQLLKQHALIAFPTNLNGFSASASDFMRCMQQVKVTVPATLKTELLYLQPTAKKSDEIGFDVLAEWLVRQDDPTASRFAQSLRTWASTPAGCAAAER